MSLKTSILVLLAWCLQGSAQERVEPWAPEMFAGKVAFTSGKYEVAVEKYREALKKADEAQTPPATLLPILKSLAGALRTNADAAAAQQILERMLALTVEVHGARSLETAPVLSELAMVQRSQDLRAEAASSLRSAMAVRGRAPVSEDVARDATLMGTIHHEMGDDALAITYYQMAISLWGALPDSGLQVLTAVEPLAEIRRNQAEYKQAEELYLWTLRLREAALGPKDAELIATLDSLAYVLFGQKKYPEAEVMYNRLLALWEMVGGPDHPMLSLTLDKMAEFYIDQKRYDKAEPLTQRALAIRSRTTLESLHRTGRILTGQQKFDEALDIYARAIRIAADARIPDEEIPGMLRAYALLLRQNRRDKEALGMERRWKDAADKKAEKEGKRPLPPSRTKERTQVL
jgi:tetratricopeptide (TPR) repeat protein